MADGGGGVGLRDWSNTLLTSMGWGTANNTFQQGSAAAAEASGKSIARQPNGDQHAPRQPRLRVVDADARRGELA